MNKQKNKDEIIVNEKFLTKAKKLIGKIPFLQNSIELYYCATDENTENWVKVLSFSALAYFVIPFDAIPDLIPIMGYTDDATIIAAAISKIGIAVDIIPTPNPVIIFVADPVSDFFTIDNTGPEFVPV